MPLGSRRAGPLTPHDGLTPGVFPAPRPGAAPPSWVPSGEPSSVPSGPHGPAAPLQPHAADGLDRVRPRVPGRCCLLQMSETSGPSQGAGHRRVHCTLIHVHNVRGKRAFTGHRTQARALHTHTCAQPHAHAPTPPRTRMHTLVHTCTHSHSPTCTPSPGVLWTRLLPAPTLLAGVSQLKPRGSSSQSLLIQRPAPEGRQAGEQGGGPAGVSGSVLRTLLQQLLCGEKRIS